MNCKLGDMAILIRGKRISGRIVEIIGVCPKNMSFRLPDGHPHAACDYEWVVRFQNPIQAPVDYGGVRSTLYAALPDRVLRPISGLPIEDEVVEDTKVPA